MVSKGSFHSVNDSQDEEDSQSMIQVNIDQKVNVNVARLLARCYVPQTEELRESLQIMDLSMKFQIYFFELSSSIFWCSAGDVLVFIFAFCIFFTTINYLGIIFLFVVHLGRGGFGGFMCFKLPNFEELMRAVDLPPEEKVGFDQIKNQSAKGFQKVLKKFEDGNAKFLLIYAILTASCLICDLVVFFFGVSKFRNDVYWGLDAEKYPNGMSNPDMTNEVVAAVVKGFYSSIVQSMVPLMLSAVFITLDLWYMIWVASLWIKLPGSMSFPIMLALCGIFKQLNELIAKETGITLASTVPEPVKKEVKGKKKEEVKSNK